MKESIFIEKLKKLGFKFTQGEFCTKDNFYVCLDCYPYFTQNINGNNLWFKTWKKFIEFYKKYT